MVSAPFHSCEVSSLSLLYHYFFVGQCVADNTDRHTGLRYSVFHFCQNMRDVNYMCEAVTRELKSWWTIDNGYCLPYPLPYQTLQLDSLAFTDNCTLSLKCALSDGLDQNCKCKSATACRPVVISSCANGCLYYPRSGSLLTPYADMCYISNRDWRKKKPDLIRFDGRVKCTGYQFIANSKQLYALSEDYPFYDCQIPANEICNTEEGIDDIRNYTGPQYDVNCWNDSKTFNNRSYQVSFLCQTRCISKYRVRDGIRDCHVNEESQTINNSCPEIQRHRLQCSSSELTCLLAGTLGDWTPSCSNGRDEFDAIIDTTPLADIFCKKNTDSECLYFRQYIQISSENNTNKVTSVDDFVIHHDSTRTIPFRSYCNSFFNTNSAFDESTDLCEEWICFRDEYQCLSGQCISQDWICDGMSIFFSFRFNFCFCLFLQVNGIVVMGQMNNVFLLWIIFMKIILNRSI
jgi:hypothetical protein